MEFEQLIQRLDWLDKERRKDKTTITALEETVRGLQGELKTASKKIKELGVSIQKNTATPAQLEILEKSIANQRTEIIKYFDEKRSVANRENETRFQENLKNLDKSVSDLNKLKNSLAAVKRELNALKEEEAHRTKLMTGWETRMQDMAQAAEHVEHSQAALEEGRKIETRRLADIQGDLSAARKKMDEYRNKYDLLADDIRRLETRLNELISGEAERRQAQLNFIEFQNLAKVERDHSLKTWEEGLDSLNKNREVLEQHLQEWETTLRGVNRARETYQDLVQKFERRINEISEMQRLSEDRFRQEWVAFKADEQKRWSSFTLSQEENRKELNNVMEKLRTNLNDLANQAKNQQDVIEQTRLAQEKLFRGLLSQVQELMAVYDQTAGRK